MQKSRIKIESIMLLLFSLVLTACATQPQQITPVLAEPTAQYRCKAKILFSDVTREFSTRETLHGHSYVLRLGEPLAQQLPAIFWTDSLSLQSGHPLPTITVGFGSGTGTQKNPDGQERFQVSLQYQIFKPSGQSRLDIVSGQSNASDPAKAVSEAMTTALMRLQRVLDNAGICRRIP